MTQIVQANVLLRLRGPSLALAPRRRRLSTIMRQHAPGSRRAIPLVFRHGEFWQDAGRDALDRAARLRSQYRTTLVGPRDTVVIITLPLGGGRSAAGGGGKSAASIGLSIASIALIAIAGPVGGAVAAASSAGIGFAVQAGLVIGADAIRLQTGEST